MDKTIKHSLASFGFLIPNNSTVTTKEFAAKIRKYSEHECAEAVATTLDSVAGYVTHDDRGWHANWLPLIENQN